MIPWEISPSRSPLSVLHIAPKLIPTSGSLPRLFPLPGVWYPLDFHMWYLVVIPVSDQMSPFQGGPSEFLKCPTHPISHPLHFDQTLPNNVAFVFHSTPRDLFIYLCIVCCLTSPSCAVSPLRTGALFVLISALAPVPTRGPGTLKGLNKHALNDYEEKCI